MSDSIILMVNREAAIHRFIAAVKKELQTETVNVILYGDGGGAHAAKHKVGWRMMADPKFREGVLARLKRDPRLEAPRFYPPCEYDGWVFTAYIAKPTAKAQYGY